MEKKSLDSIYIWSVVKKLNTVLFGLLATMLIHRLLSPEQKGQYEYVNNIISLSITILNLGISLVLPNYVRKKYSWTFSTFYALSIVQFVLMVLGSAVFSAWKGSWSILLYGCAVSFGVFSLQVLNCTMIFNFKATVLANCTGVIVNAALLAAALFIKVSNFNVIFLALVVKEALCAFICFYAVRKEFHLSEVKVGQWRSILTAGLIPMLTSLMSIMNYKVDVIEMKWLGVTDYNIGIYSVGLSIAEYVLILCDIFKDVLFNKTAKSDNLAHITLSLRFCSTLMISVFFILIVGGKFVIWVLYGEQYLMSYAVTLIVVLGVYSMMYFKLLGVLYVAQGKWWFYFGVLLCSVIINIVSNLILIPVLDIYGAAITSVLSYSFSGLAFLFGFMKQYSVRMQDIVLIKREDFILLSNIVKRRN